MFSEMLDRVKREVVTILARARIRNPDEIKAEEERRRLAEKLQYRHDEVSAMVPEGAEVNLDPEAPARRPLVARPGPRSAPWPVLPSRRCGARKSGA